MEIIFQFHKGAIRTKVEYSSAVICINFNSIKVRLELNALRCFKDTLSNFNSIKVRLEPAGINPYLAMQNEFQFHKGAIRTWSSFHPFSSLTEFQFHKGAIRTMSGRSHRLMADISIP